MSKDLNIEHCPKCGRIYQRNLRNLCSPCSMEEDRTFRAAEYLLVRNRRFSNEELAAAASVPPEKIRTWIRAGKIPLTDYPNLHDFCDSCRSPIRKGTLCHDCSRRIRSDLAHSLEQERLMKERQKASSAYISRG